MQSGTCKVLLIEDDLIDQTAFIRTVDKEKLGYDYTIAGTVSEAKRILKKQEFDVVIADYMLKDGTGFDILDSVRDTPIIFATGAGDEKLAVKAMKAGAYDYLIKNRERSYLTMLPMVIENAVNHAKMEKEVKVYHENLEELVRDRTEQLKAEKELLSVTFSSMTDGVIVVDANKQVVLFNKVAEVLTGIRLEEAKGRAVEDIFQIVDERTREPIADLITKVLVSSDVKTRIQPAVFLSENSNDHPVSIAAAPIRRAKAKVSGVVMLLHDLSEQREIDRMKDDFVSSVSHELRTPLTSIKAFTETILRDPDMPEKQKREFLLVVDKESNRLADLVNGLLEISQLAAGRSQVVRKPMDFITIVEQVISSLKTSAENKKIALKTQMPGAVPLYYGHETKIRSMLSNLVSNAIKFTPEGGKVTVAVGCDEEELEIKVTDTGIGIPNEEITKIFNRFYRVQQPGMQIPGTGLGLAIVNEVVFMHGGNIEVESQPGHGTTFRIIMPITGRLVCKTVGN